jgi:hypothetical protein
VSRPADGPRRVSARSRPSGGPGVYGSTTRSRTPWSAASEHTHSQAELDAQREMQRAKAEERDELSAAAREVVDAVDEHQTLAREATSAQTEANRIRRHADSLTQRSRPALSTGKTQELVVKTTDVPFAVLRFQYQLARVPLQLIEEQMAAWMGSEAPPRVVYARWLGGLDATVDNLLGDPKLEKRGAALIERREALGGAAQLDAPATPQHEQADDELKAKRDTAIKDQKDARAAKERQLKEARTAAEQRTRAVAQAAEKRTAAAKQQADDVAAQRKKSAAAAQREEQAKITAAEQTATAGAESKRTDAQATRSDAASMRAQADQAEQLADVEKQQRQSERAEDA